MPLARSARLGSLKKPFFVVGGAAGLLLVIALAAPLFLDINLHKSRVETAASEKLGMDVRIGGRMRMGFFPGFHVSAEDVRILNEQTEAIASAHRTRLGIDLLPLLRKRFRLSSVDLTQPMLSIQRDSEGRFNVERLKTTLLGALDGAKVSIADGTLHYADSSSGAAIEATGFDLRVSRLRFVERKSPQFWKRLSMEAEIACDSIRTMDFSVSTVTVSARAKDGIVTLEPVTMNVFGGQVAGSLRGEFARTAPVYDIRCSLPRFRVEEFLKRLSPDGAAAGAMDFTANLTMNGRSRDALMRSATGAMSLRGENLTLIGNDLDRTISRFESSQSFNFVDVGALFFAGPLGLAVTKGYNFASLFRGSEESSQIRSLVSDWGIERGVAHAKDVAMATTENRLALTGSLDFVNARFDDVTVAVIDAKGCATVRQVIHGSFAQPVVEKPHILTSLAGPVLKLYRQTRGLFPAAPCEGFYLGSVAAPQ